MITKAACEVLINGTLRVIPVHRHGDIGLIFKAFGFDPHKGYKILRQGFLDEKDNFLTREEAYHHAVECGQIESSGEEKELFSEDLW